MKISVLSRVHKGHVRFFDTWFGSIKSNSFYIDKVILWLHDKETSSWYLSISTLLDELDVEIVAISNLSLNPLSCLTYINDLNMNIGAVLDFDDIWLPTHLKTAFLSTDGFLKKSFYAGCNEFVDETATISLGSHMIPKNHHDILLHTPIAFSSMVWSPGSVHLRSEFKRLVDQSLLYFAFKNNDVAVSSLITVKIRKYNSSMSTNIISQVIDRFTFFKLVPNPLIFLNLFVAMKKKISLILPLIFKNKLIRR
mgnify:CR=1 FL=1